MTVKEYLEKLAEPSFPGPASGSAAATVAAMAAALLQMSCEITMKKEAHSKCRQESIRNIEAIRKHCLYLATEDMKAYGEVVKATKSKKEFPGAYEAALKSGTDTLVSIVKNCESILTQIEEVIGTCYIKVLGDLAGSAYMADAAAAAATRGVEVNLLLLHDESYKEDVLKLIHNSYGKCFEIKNRIVATTALKEC